MIMITNQRDIAHVADIHAPMLEAVRQACGRIDAFDHLRRLHLPFPVQIELVQIDFGHVGQQQRGHCPCGKPTQSKRLI